LHRLPPIILSLKWRSPKASSCVTVPVTAGLWVRHIFNSRESGRKSEAAAIRQIERAENQKESYKRLRRFMGKGMKGGLTHILIEQPDGTTECITDKQEMYERIVERNKVHFGQADGTPFTVSPLTDILGRYGTTQEAEWLLDGKFPLDTISEKLDAQQEAKEAIMSFLRQLGKGGCKDGFPDYVTVQDYKQGYGRWRESTSTSPSGLHLGHEKALFKMENDEGEEETKLSTRIFTMKVKFINFAIKHCHVYRRWTKIVNATIEKIPGKPLLHKLRIIHLIESDFNLMIGILWGRRLMKNAEKLKMLGGEQQGSREDRSAPEVLVQKQTIYSILRMARYNGATFDNDAKSCYDRIVMLVASLASQRAGMTKAACELFLSTLDKVQYHIKTNLGISEESYSTTEDRTVHGPGQGGRGSPGIWVTISCLIMECLQEKSNGIEISGPEGDEIERIFSSGFVDDVTLWTGNMMRSLQGNESAQGVLEEMETAAQWWEQLLFTTGGKLELSKCFFYLIYWVFNDEGEPRMLHPNEFPIPIEITDSETGRTYRIETKPCNQAHKTLGAMESPDSDYSQETERLTKKSEDFARRAQSMKITSEEANMLYFTMIQPSMLYSAPAGTLSRSEADRINSNITRSILASMGYNRNMPKRAVYGPKEMGGLGLMDIFIEQGAAKALFLVRHLRTNRTLGKSMRAQLQWAQRVAGTDESILMDTKTRIPQLDEEVWISTLRQFLDESEMGIDIDNIATVKAKREKDKPIMSLVSEWGDTDKIRINRCRMYLKAETIADLSNAAGTHITEQAMDCRETAILEPKAKWPRQTRPGPKHRAAWRKLLKSICKDSTSELLESLGNWNPDNPSEKKWDAYFDAEKDKVYVRCAECPMFEHSIESKSRHEMVLERGRLHFEQVNTKTLVPLDLWTSGEKWRVNKPHGWIEKAAPISEKTRWKRHVAKRDEWEKDLLQNVMQGSTQEKHIKLRKALKDEKETIIIVSDGGCKDKAGSYGWVIALESTGETLWEHKGRARGGDMNSYRAEAYGMLSATAFLVAYIDLFPNTGTAKCRIRAYCDNKSLVDELQWEKTHNKASEALKPEFDMLVAIERTNERLDNIAEMRYPCEHVKGHQDKTIPMHELSLPARLNIRADVLATDELQNVERGNEFMEMIRTPHCGAFIINKNIQERRNETMTRGEAKALKEKYLQQQLMEYFEERFGFDTTKKTIDDVNFEGLRLAIKDLDGGERKYYSKLSIGWLPTGKKLELYGDAITYCHRCKGDETADHIIQCPANKTLAAQIAMDLQTYLAEIHTDPTITRLFCRGIHRWIMHNENASEPLATDDEDGSIAMEAQNRIGWHLAMRGWMSKQWARMQESWAKRRKSNQNREHSGNTWSAKVSKWLIRKSKEFWTERNHQRQESSSPDDQGTSRAEKEVNARMERLYARDELSPKR
jgi:ribonuclease HI